MVFWIHLPVQNTFQRNNFKFVTRLHNSNRLCFRIKNHFAATRVEVDLVFCVAQFEDDRVLSQVHPLYTNHCLAVSGFVNFRLPYSKLFLEHELGFLVEVVFLGAWLYFLPWFIFEELFDVEVDLDLFFHVIWMLGDVEFTDLVPRRVAYFGTHFLNHLSLIIVVNAELARREDEADTVLCGVVHPFRDMKADSLKRDLRC